GNGTVSLTAPADGTYAGILIFQSRDNTRALAISGNAALGLGGTVYAKAALLSLSGNGTLHEALVVDRITISGNGGAGLMADGAAGSDAADVAGQLLGRDLWVYVDNTSGVFTDDELARIQDTIVSLNAFLASYNVTVTQVGAEDSSWANVTIDIAATS